MEVGEKDEPRAVWERKRFTLNDSFQNLIYLVYKVQFCLVKCFLLFFYSFKTTEKVKIQHKLHDAIVFGVTLAFKEQHDDDQHLTTCTKSQD